MKQQLWTAHSGADGLPDNSMLFVRYALRTQADALEVDVRRHPVTGELLLGHDTIGENPVTLREVLEEAAAHPSMRVNCDLKEPHLEREVLRLAQQTGMQPRLILSGTVQPEHMADADFRARQVYWNIENCFPDFYEQCAADPDAAPRGVQEMCARCRAVGVGVINLCELVVDERVLAIAAREHIRLSVWTVNRPARMAWLRAHGVYNITTRRIAQALSLPHTGAQTAAEASCSSCALFDQSFVWHPAHSASDVPFAFSCPASVQELHISFTYAPGDETNAACVRQVEDAITRYYDRYPRELEPMTVQQYLPVKNLITLSLEKDGVYLGNGHRWDTAQDHVISTDYASFGFSSPQDMQGQWRGMLHLHEIISPTCTGTLRVEGRQL